MSDDRLIQRLEIVGQDRASAEILRVAESLKRLDEQARRTNTVLGKALSGKLGAAMEKLKADAKAFTSALSDGATTAASALKADVTAAGELRDALAQVVAETKRMGEAARASQAAIRSNAAAGATAARSAAGGRARASRDAIEDVGRIWRIRQKSEKAELDAIAKVRTERAKLQREAATAARRAFRHGSHAVHRISPAHEGVRSAASTALLAGTVAAGAVVDRAVRASEALDSSVVRLRMFGPELDSVAIRKQALGDSIALGIGADKIVDSIAKSVRDGVPPAIAKTLPKSIASAAQVMGGDVERLTDSLAEGIQEAYNIGWLKDATDARRFLNTEAGLSTFEGNTAAKQEQFISAGGLGHGKEMGLSMTDSLAFGAMLNASGARTGQASARFMGQLSQNIPKMFDKYREALMSRRNSEESRAVRSAPSALGYGTIREMQAKIMAGPSGLIDFATRLQRLDDKGRKLVLEGYGFSEQGGAMLAELGANGGQKGKAVLARAKELAEQREANDYLSEKFAAWQTSLSNMLKQIEAGWRAIESEVGEVIKSDIIAPLRDWWVQLSTVIIDSDLKDRVHQAILGFIHGLGFDDLKQLLDRLTANARGFDVAGFFRGLGEGIRASVDELRSLAGVFGSGGMSAETVGKVAAEFIGLSLALRIVSPVVGVLEAIGSAVLALRAALSGVSVAARIMGIASAVESLAAAAGIGVVSAGILSVSIAAIAVGAIAVTVMNWNEIKGFFSDLWNRKPDPNYDPTKPLNLPSPTDGLMQLNAYKGDNWSDLRRSISYAPSDSGEVVKDAILSTDDGVAKVYLTLLETNALLRAAGAAASGTMDAHGGEPGAANLRYGRGSNGQYRGTPGGGGAGGPLAGGGSGGSRSWRNNNPGNIEYGAFAKSMGAIGSDGRFAVFSSYDAGRKAQESLLFESKGYKDLTLGQAIAKWAPGSENNVPAYIAAMGGDPNTRMSAFSPAQRSKLLDAMQAHEGWKVGSRKNGLLGSVDASGISGGGSAGGAVDIALGMANKGVGAREASQALGHMMTAGLWCADFVNGALGKAGVQGSGSSMANSFSRWGRPVDFGDVKKGDVIEENSGRGTRIHHAGLATGRVQRDANGNVTAVEMVSGNYGNQVRTNWEKIGIIADLRRSNQAVEETAKKVIDQTHKSTSETKRKLTTADGDEASSSSATYHNTFHVHGARDPHETAVTVARHLFNSCTHDVDAFA